MCTWLIWPRHVNYLHCPDTRDADVRALFPEYITEDTSCLILELSHHCVRKKLGILTLMKGHSTSRCASTRMYDAENPDLQPCAAQTDGDGRFSVAPPDSNNSLDGIFAQGVVTRTYTQVRQVRRLSRHCAQGQDSVLRKQRSGSGQMGSY